MTQSPLRIFNLEGDKIVEQPVGLNVAECHPHNFLDGSQNYAGLSDDLKNICTKLNDAGQAFDIVKVGVGDRMSSKICDQKTFVAPINQRHLSV